MGRGKALVQVRKLLKTMVRSSGGEPGSFRLECAIREADTGGNCSSPVSCRVSVALGESFIRFAMSHELAGWQSQRSGAGSLFPRSEAQTLEMTDDCSQHEDASLSSVSSCVVERHAADSFSACPSWTTAWCPESIPLISIAPIAHACTVGATSGRPRAKSVSPASTRAERRDFSTGERPIFQATKHTIILP